MTAPARKPLPPSHSTRHSNASPVKPLTVFFLRHGEAGQRSAWAGNDTERPLTDDGRKQVRRVARALVRLGLVPELILSSPYARAMETAKIAAKVLGVGDRVVAEPALVPGAQMSGLSSVIYSHPDVVSVLIVGHEPQISSFIASICGGGQMALDKAGVAEVRLDHAHDPPGVLVWLTQPGRLSS